MKTHKILSEVPVYKQIPKGWKELEGAQTAPVGYVWIYNGKSLFSGDYKHGLLEMV